MAGPYSSAMRRGPTIVLALVGFAVGVTLLGALMRARPGPTAVVLVSIDTLRADHVGAHGRTPSPTPRIDAVAAAGAVFERAWTTAPLTVPAHATMLTGRIPPQHGLRSNRPSAPLPARADRSWATLAEAFRGSGFRTGAFVSASVLRADRTGLDAGFERYDDVERAAPGSLVENERRGEATVDAALAWVRSGDGPVFLFVHLFDPHAPYDAPQPWGAGTAHAADGVGYLAEVAYADHCVGRLLDGLRDAGFPAPVVAVTSDHGEALGEHGESTHGFLLHEATLHVPLVLSAPESGLSARRYADPVTLRDLAPTLLRLAGDQPVPEGMATRSLLEPGGVSAVYAESIYGHAAFRWAQAFAVRTGTTKRVDAGPVVLEYDLAADPSEATPRVLDATRLDGATAEAVEALRTVARGVPEARIGPRPAAIEGGSYFGAATPASAVLPVEENARLPSPYDRIGDVRVLDAAKVLISAGAAAQALTSLDELARAAPGNPEVPFWRGRALHRLQRPGEAAAAFRQAARTGRNDADCVASALRSSLQQFGRDADAAGLESALAFLSECRGRGLSDDGWTHVLESAIHLARADPAAAEKALDRARPFAQDPALEKAVRETSQALDAARSGRR